MARLLPDDVAAAAGSIDLDPWPAVAAVCAHLAVYAAVAGVVVWVQDARRRRPG